MDNIYIQSLRKQLKKVFKNDKNRYWHTIGVANTSACLAMRYNVDVEKAFTAGLLHDCAKCLSDSELLSECQKNSIKISNFEHTSPYLLHGKLGAFYAKTKYEINDNDILNAISYHTTGRPGMSKLEEIVFIADYIEPLRNKASDLEDVRKMVFCDIELAILMVLESTLDYLRKNNRPIDKTTTDTYIYYQNLINERNSDE